MATYSPADITISYKGITLSGYGPDTIIEIERNSDSFTLQMGADGEGVRTRSADKSGKATLTLQQGSAGNDYLSTQIENDEAGTEGGGVLIVKDNAGSSLYHAANAWLTKPASAGFAKETGTREWVFETDKLEMKSGASNP